MEGVSLDKRSWLEVRDPQHRYGKLLRLYYSEWDRLGKPGNSFFRWLEQREEGVEGCAREELDRDTVRYLSSDEERAPYLITIEEVTNRVVVAATGAPVETRSKGWIFVLRSGQLLAAEKRTTPPRFHHSSFYGGEYVEAAGMFVCSPPGVLTRVYAHSGHYRPSDFHLHTLLTHLQARGIDLAAISVDGQRTFKLARCESEAGAKVPKLESSLMLSGRELLDFLSHKRRAWASQLFRDVQRAARGRAIRRGHAAALLPHSLQPLRSADTGSWSGSLSLSPRALSGAGDEEGLLQGGGEGEGGGGEGGGAGENGHAGPVGDECEPGSDERSVLSSRLLMSTVPS